MIPEASIIEWRATVPWVVSEQVEQDLVICRALAEIFKNEYLRTHLAFRGGTALHKLYLHPQPRYSEDIDLVQIEPEPIRTTIDNLRDVLNFLGEPNVKQKKHNNTLIYRFESETIPVAPLKLKVEINCKEHFHIQDLKPVNFSVNNSWYSGECQVLTYELEELVGTKMRALYQRRKGRDLYDLYKALTSNNNLDLDLILTCYRAYMDANVDTPPSRKQYLNNLNEKMEDDEFLGDTESLLRPGERYNPEEAYSIVREQLLNKI